MNFLQVFYYININVVNDSNSLYVSFHNVIQIINIELPLYDNSYKSFFVYLVISLFFVNVLIMMVYFILTAKLASHDKIRNLFSSEMFYMKMVLLIIKLITLLQQFITANLTVFLFFAYYLNPQYYASFIKDQISSTFFVFCLYFNFGYVTFTLLCDLFLNIK